MQTNHLRAGDSSETTFVYLLGNGTKKAEFENALTFESKRPDVLSQTPKRFIQSA